MKKIASCISTVFSPLLVPTYSYATALWITPLAVLPERVRLISSLMIFLITATIPMATILMLMRTGRIGDYAITDRRQRTVPMIVAILCYVGASFYLRFVHAPGFLIHFFIGAAAAAVLALGINFRWKISAHMTAIGGYCALLIWIAVHALGIVMMMPWITGAVIIAGCVGSSRLYLLRHTPAQVYAGFCLGAVCAFLFMSL